MTIAEHETLSRYGRTMLNRLAHFENALIVVQSRVGTWPSVEFQGIVIIAVVVPPAWFRSSFGHLYAPGKHNGKEA